MNDLQKSYEKRAIELSEKYKALLQEQRLIENHVSLIKSELIDYLGELEEKKIGTVKLVEKVQTKKVTIEEIASLFNGGEKELLEKMFNCFVVEVDIEKTIDNLVMLGGYQLPLAKKIGLRLENIQLKKYMDLEIKI